MGEGAEQSAVVAVARGAETPGGFFVIHPAYGRIGETEVGGTEIIGYDSSTGTYTTHFFDSMGNATISELACD